MLKSLMKASFTALFLFAGSPVSAALPGDEPKVVVGIVVDQMRGDFIRRFSPCFTEGGFKRLVKEGANFTNANINYIPTITAPGHASVYTGTTPYFHGIISNDWYSREEKRMINVNEDYSQKSDNQEEDASPRKLLTSTMTDELKLATGFRSRVFGISIKDRGAILPAGKIPDGAFWYNHRNGTFISSSYYKNQSPDWLDNFNKRNSVSAMLQNPWVLSGKPGDYKIADDDNVPYEPDLFEEGDCTFPHSFDKLSDGEKFEKLPFTPSGNVILAELFKQVILKEIKNAPYNRNFVAVSFSSTDYAGHAYGPASVEVMDMYIKLDSVLADMLSFLDSNIGKGNYLLFLTADHGAVDMPEFLSKHGCDAGRLSPPEFKTRVEQFATRKFGTKAIIENISNRQIFCNYTVIDDLKMKRADVFRAFKDFLIDSVSLVATVLTRTELEGLYPSRSSENLLLNGFNLKRSGDVLFEFKPNYLFTSSKNTTHSTGYDYDTHIPIVFFGWGVKPLESNTPVYVVDIAPTVCSLLGIPFPDGNMGIPLFQAK